MTEANPGVTNTCEPPGPASYAAQIHRGVLEGERCVDLMAELYGRSLVAPIGQCVAFLSRLATEAVDRWGDAEERSRLRAARWRESLADLSGQLEQLRATLLADTSRLQLLQVEAERAGLKAQVDSLEESVRALARSPRTADRKIQEARRAAAVASMSTASEQVESAAAA